MSLKTQCLDCGIIITQGDGHTCKVEGHNIRLERDALLVERQKTHGSFEINASASQQIKDIYNNYSYRNCKPVHREALDMIALKLSRILSGQANFKDHWDDIAGYAKLGSEACDG